jgi:hypothetical protein
MALVHEAFGRGSIPAEVKENYCPFRNIHRDFGVRWVPTNLSPDIQKNEACFWLQNSIWQRDENFYEFISMPPV